ncbi:MAG: hypothetical protein OEU50_04270 [Gammaproteobacteria bacterium]|nr:hypothetical protein [Gammaproteobacteria bacterium]
MIFMRSGFVRAGPGLGGAVPASPLLLTVGNRPLMWLPILALRLLFLSATGRSWSLVEFLRLLRR